MYIIVAMVIPEFTWYLYTISMPDGAFFVGRHGLFHSNFIPIKLSIKLQFFIHFLLKISPDYNIAVPIEHQCSMEFQSLEACFYLNFAHFHAKNKVYLAKNAALNSRWHCNQEWRSIGAITICMKLSLSTRKLKIWNISLTRGN